MERCRYPWVRSVHTSYTEQRGRELRQGPDDDPLRTYLIFCPICSLRDTQRRLLSRRCQVSNKIQTCLSQALLFRVMELIRMFYTECERTTNRHEQAESNVISASQLS